MITIEQVGKKLLSSINGVLTGGDSRVPPDLTSKTSWCQPGIPFSPDSFEFGSNRIFNNALTAEQVRRLSRQAFDFACAVDFVPDVTGVYAGDAQQNIFRTSGVRLSSIYGEVLKASKVVRQELTAAEQAKLEKFRKLLFVEKELTNLVTGEVTRQTVPGPVLVAYAEAKANYLKAATNYNCKRIMSQVATGEAGAAPVLDFQLNGENYAAEVQNQLQLWVGQGYKNEVDEMLAYINQVTQRSMVLWKQGLLDAFNRSVMTDVQTAAPFRYTTFSPANFATGDGWTRFEQAYRDSATSASSYSSSWGGGGGLGFGFWSFGASAGGSTSAASSQIKLSGLKISFELTQAMIIRPWFFPEFFSNRGWILQPGHGWNFDQLPSDGGTTPRGLLIGYPTQAVFIRNLVIESDEFASAFSHHASNLSAGASVGWGPFSFHGSYSRAESQTNTSMQIADGRITVPGMQLIAFLSQLIPKSPNPLEGLPADRFV